MNFRKVSLVALIGVAIANLTACGGGSSSLSNPEPQIKTTSQETWNAADEPSPIRSTDSSYLLWGGTPEVPPTQDPGFSVPTPNWWIQDLETGAYLPGLSRLQTFTSSPFLVDSNVLFATKDGHVFQIDLTQGSTWIPIQVSSLNDASSIEATFRDSTGQTVLRVRTLSGSLMVVKPTPAMNDTPQAVAVSNVYELHAFWDANGQLQGRLVIDRDKWELALLSDDESRVLQHFALPENLDRSVRPAQWIGPQWRAHAGVIQIGQDLYRFDWRGPIATLSNSLYHLQEVDTYTSNHRYVADDTRLYVSDGWNLVSIGPSGPASALNVTQDSQAPSTGGIKDVLLTQQALVVHYHSGTGSDPGLIRRIDRQTQAITEIGPTSPDRSIHHLIWADDQSIGFFESGGDANHLVRWTPNHEYTILAVNPYVFEQPTIYGESITHSESGFSHRLDFIDWTPQPPYSPDWSEPQKYLSIEPARQIWWCDSTQNFAIWRMCDPTSGIQRYDIQTRQLTQQGQWPSDAHINQVFVLRSGLAVVFDADLVDTNLTGYRMGYWRLDTIGNKAPFFLSAQVLSASPKVSPDAPTPAAASSQIWRSKSE